MQKQIVYIPIEPPMDEELENIMMQENELIKREGYFFSEEELSQMIANSAYDIVLNGKNVNTIIKQLNHD